ncbi:MFS transporter [Rhodococcus wratislaviensis]|uniref:Putative major facilitator superfamily transporter n=1 Tax=Rhodococcus wratislaviensis NBRC 100605 TaxID=1219028 RepID=X0PTZ2_RHOWR|nr:MFS transporter [Rhodococcus wratislaviensis]GAF46563.1 putative major facilitator superfamily transporter [Rhodococcus wratislaviensis NBRC 100605]
METGKQAAATSPPPSLALPRLTRVIGFLVFTEIVYGILRAFYGPIVSDIADHLDISDGEFNWFETAQHGMAALMVLTFSRLGDIRGHKRVLIWTTSLTALGSWILVFAPSFSTFLIGYALMGACAVWLPIEIAIIYRRTAGSDHQHRLSRRAAGILVSVFYVSMIGGAISSGALIGAMPLPVLLSIPALLATACVVVIWFGIESDESTAAGARLDRVGLGLLTASLAAFMTGMVFIHIQGVTSTLGWLLVGLSLAILIPFARYEARQSEPMIDVRLLKIRAQWPVQLAALLFGIALLGAEVPFFTYARTDPDITGYGLGTGAGFVSVGIATHVIFIAIGALSFPSIAVLLGARRAVVIAAFVGAVGFGLWVPFHSLPGQALVNLAITGLGAGAIMAALPVLAAMAAPSNRTGFATGMTSAGKTIGGAIATSAFAIVLSATGSLDGLDKGYAPFSGYLTVWSTSTAAALLAGLALLMLPRSVDEEPVARTTV